MYIMAITRMGKGEVSPRQHKELEEFAKISVEALFATDAELKRKQEKRV